MTSRRRHWLNWASIGGRVGREWPPSPVPSDADLWPGELPFTAWGHHEYGTLDLRVFDQSLWWVSVAQRPIRLDAMSPGYVANVIQMLEAYAEYYYLCTLRRECLQRYGDALLGRFSTGEIAEAAGAVPLSELTPIAWLESTPLMRRLRQEQRLPPNRT
jgi:hypothetical protein